MARFNETKNEIICNKNDIKFNFVNVPKDCSNFFDLIDNVELSVFNVGNVTQQIKDKYSHSIINIIIEDSYDGVKFINLKTNYVGLGSVDGVFKGNIFCSEDSELGKLVLNQYAINK